MKKQNSPDQRPRSRSRSRPRISTADTSLTIDSEKKTKIESCENHFKSDWFYLGHQNYDLLHKKLKYHERLVFRLLTLSFYCIYNKNPMYYVIIIQVHIRRVEDTPSITSMFC